MYTERSQRCISSAGKSAGIIAGMSECRSTLTPLTYVRYDSLNAVAPVLLTTAPCRLATSYVTSATSCDRDATAQSIALVTSPRYRASSAAASASLA